MKLEFGNCLWLVLQTPLKEEKKKSQKVGKKNLQARICSKTQHVQLTSLRPLAGELMILPPTKSG
jgi:hypothetical protein